MFLNAEYMTLQVPTDKAMVYREATGWERFGDIIDYVTKTFTVDNIVYPLHHVVGVGDSSTNRSAVRSLHLMDHSASKNNG